MRRRKSVEPRFFVGIAAAAVLCILSAVYSGVTGNRSAYVLEQGTYTFYIGSDVRSAAYAGECHLEEQVAEQLQEAMAPVSVFQRMKPEKGKDGYHK